MFMENLVMTTTLTNEELDATVTAQVCAGCKYGGYAPEELDATAEAVAMALICTGPCIH